MSIKIFETEKLAVGVGASAEWVNPFSASVVVRVVGDVDFHVAKGEVGEREEGLVVFVDQPQDGATITIDDGVNDPVVFEFESAGGVTGANVEVAIGGTAQDTADNLVTAIEAAVTGGDLNVEVVQDGLEITILNNFLVGGALSSSGEDDDFSVTDFDGGVDGVQATNDDMLVAEFYELCLKLEPGEDLSVRGAATGSVWITRIAYT